MSACVEEKYLRTRSRELGHSRQLHTADIQVKVNKKRFCFSEYFTTGNGHEVAASRSISHPLEEPRNHYLLPNQGNYLNNIVGCTSYSVFPLPFLYRGFLRGFFPGHTLEINPADTLLGLTPGSMWYIVMLLCGPILFLAMYKY